MSMGCFKPLGRDFAVNSELHQRQGLTPALGVREWRLELLKSNFHDSKGGIRLKKAHDGHSFVVVVSQPSGYTLVKPLLLGGILSERSVL